MVKSNRKVFKLFIIFTIILSMFSVSTITALADNKDDKWVTKKKEELQMPDKEWKIVFSTELDKKTITKDNIYILDSENNKFNNIELKQVQENIVTVAPKKEYKQGAKYFLCIDKGLKSYQGKAVEPYRVQFEIKKIDSDFFKIKNVKAVSKNMINVYFTQPINKDAKLPLYYQLMKNGNEVLRGSYQTMEIKTIDGSNDGVTIHLKDKTLLPGERYTIKILGDLMSDYGVRLSKGEGDQIDFDGTDKENEEIAVKGSYPLNSTTVRIEFNKAIDGAVAEQLNNYTIRDLKGALKGPSKVTVSKDLKTVDLTVVGTLKKNTEYEVLVRGIKDKFKQSKLEETKGPIYWGGEVVNDLKIAAAGAFDKNTMYLYFNNKPDLSSALMTSNYQIKGVSERYFFTTPSKVYYDPKDNTERIKLYFNRELKEGKVYKLVVSKRMKDEMGNTCSKDLEYEFAGTNTEHEGIYINEAVIIGKDYVKLSFNGEILESGANLKSSNYTLISNQGENRKIIIGCTDVKYVDAKTLILKFDNLDFNEDYILKIDTLVDYIGKESNVYSTGVQVTMGD